MNSEAPPTKSKLLLRCEWIGCLVVALAAIWLHVFNLHHAGGLWRDEVGGFSLATSATLGELWSLLTLDSFPLAMPVLLRAWNALGFADTDPHLRWLGLLIGLALLAAIWLGTFAITKRPALIALALLATSSTVIRWGDSLRAYGLGCVFLLLTLGAIWSLLQKPDWRRFTLTTVFAVLSVQTLYQNAFLLLAMCCGAWAVCVPKKNWRATLLVGAAGVIAAATLVPYLAGMVASQKWWALQNTGFKPHWIWERLYIALSVPCEWQPLVWLAVFVLAIIVGLAAWRKRDSAHADRKIFALTTLFASLVLFTLFIWLTRLPTQVWYFLPLLALGAVCCDAILTDAFAGAGGWRLGLLGLMALLPLSTVADSLKRRLTNADLILPQIAAEATANDLIVVQPWYAGVEFQRYYHGRARWTTIPQLADFRLQRFDLVREKMIAGNAAAPVLAECEKTLAAGHRVWLVGLLHWFQIPPVAPDEPPPPPTGPDGWNEFYYEQVWFGQVAHFLTLNSVGSPRVMMPPETEVFEDIEYYVFEGRKVDAPTQP
ncbi:MAG: hypothetical protein EXS35_04900 [Pedosphaera sp.]|nr:hypothetical protein [Pedosphaera sp.]